MSKKWKNAPMILTARDAKFNLEFMVAMIGAGREDYARIAFSKAHHFLSTVDGCPWTTEVEYSKETAESYGVPFKASHELKEELE